MSVPSPSRRRAVTLLAALPWPLVLFQFLVALPRYDKMFREFGLKIDDFAALLLNVSAWVRNHYLLAGLITFGLMAASMFTAHTVQSFEMPAKRRAAILLFVFGVPCLVFGLAWLGVLNTHRTLVEGIKK
jgi:hypothetical protein